MMFAQYGADIYTRGLQVHTTVRADEQETAYLALRRGILDYEQRQHYRGPEKFLTLPANPAEREDMIDDALIDAGDKGDLLAAVVIEASLKKVRVARHNSEYIEITGEGLKPVQSGLSEKAPPNLKLRPGALVRIAKGAKGWEITQLPEVEGAFVAIDPRDGAIRSLVGGFDFEKNKFNHVTQAWRQPGSSFKPFIYSAALEKGLIEGADESVVSKKSLEEAYSLISEAEEIYRSMYSVDSLRVDYTPSRLLMKAIELVSDRTGAVILIRCETTGVVIITFVLCLFWPEIKRKRRPKPWSS